MPTYTYQARDETGRLVRGVLEADSQIALADRLKKMGYLVTQIRESKGLSMPALAHRRSVPREVTLFAIIQLANLLEAGIPLTTAIRTVAEQCPSVRLRCALEESAKAVEGGSSFSQALEQYASILPSLMPQLVAAGEASGKLDKILLRMAEVLEKELNLRRSIQAAVTYPILVVAAGLLLVIFVVSFVIPQFALLFTKAGIPMPLPTQILTAIGFSLKHHGLFWIAGFGLGVLGLGWLFKQPFIRRKMDEWILTVPLVGDAVRQTILIRFARTLALLFGSGIPILHALKTAQQVVGNSSLAREVDRVGMAVERGERIASVLSTGRFFYPDAIQMVRVGEESGRLDEMLNKVAEVYELRLGHTLKQATTLLEPLLIVLTGGLVAFIMVSMLLPMFEMVRLLQKGGIR